MTIHFFTKGDISGATARYRGFIVARELTERGIKTVVHRPPNWRPFFKVSAARITELRKYAEILKSVKNDDIIYLVRTVYQFDFLFLIVMFKILYKKKFIFDFDDPIFLRKGFKFKMIILTKLANAVIVGSHYLAEWASQYNRNVSIIPTSIPLERYAKYTKNYQSAGELVIGWVGNGPAHIENLKILLPVFNILIADGLIFRFVLIGSLEDRRIYNLFASVGKLQVDFIDSLIWENPENLAREIQRFDIGLMPLIDNEWNRGKCSFKAIEYMACGVVPVVSPVGENVHLIQDGVNGFLAKDSQDWVEKIINLFKNKELLPPIGRKAQLTIKNQYSFSANIPKIIEIIKGL